MFLGSLVTAGMAGLNKYVLLALGAALVGFGVWWLWDSRQDALRDLEAAQKEVSRLHEINQHNALELRRIGRARALANDAARRAQEAAETLRARNAALSEGVRNDEDGPLSPVLLNLNQRLRDAADSDAD